MLFLKYYNKFNKDVLIIWMCDIFDGLTVWTQNRRGDWEQYSFHCF